MYKYFKFIFRTFWPKNKLDFCSDYLLFLIFQELGRTKMGKISFFKILFDKKEPIYFVGETLVGKISIGIQERLKINSIFLHIEGETNVHWTEEVTITTKNRTNHGSGHSTRIGHHSTDHFKGHEKHFSFKIVLIHEQKSDMYLEVGEFTYPFKVNLPDALPTSFEHQNARTRYCIHASIDIPW